MGIYEYDRIRSKNKVYNEAYEKYVSLKNEGLADEDILAFCEKCQQVNEHDGIRNEIYLAIINIVKGSHDNESS